MSEPNELISFMIFGQEFRLRALPDEHERIQRIAAAVDRRVRTHREQATSDLRATLMAAYEIAFEKDDTTPPDGESNISLNQINQRIDNILARIEKKATP